MKKAAMSSLRIHSKHYAAVVVLTFAYVLTLTCASVSGTSEATAAGKKPPSRGASKHLPRTTTSTSLAAALVGLNNNASLSSSCVAAEQFTDIASRTVLASVVFEGRVVRLIRSVGSDGADAAPATTTVDVVFAATRVFKGEIAVTDGVLSESAHYPTVVVGPFVESVPTSGRSKSNDLCGGRAPTVPPLTTEQQQQQLYLVFVDQSDDGTRDGNSDDERTGDVPLYYRVAGQPVVVSKQAVKEVQAHSCSGCAKRPSGVQLTPDRSTLSVVAGRSWTLECKAGQGRPAPKFSWFKGDVEIRPTARVQIKNAKKRGSRVSKLMVNKATEDDIDSYKCRASNAVGFVDSKSVHVAIDNKAAVPPSDVSSHAYPCPADVKDYCMNGGTCQLFSLNSEKFCSCPPEFAGKRCEQKNLPVIAKSQESGVASPFNNLDYFLVIALSAIAFTVSVATAIFVCCHLRKCLQLKHTDKIEFENLIIRPNGTALRLSKPRLNSLADAKAASSSSASGSSGLAKPRSSNTGCCVSMTSGNYAAVPPVESEVHAKASTGNGSRASSSGRGSLQMNGSLPSCRTTDHQSLQLINGRSVATNSTTAAAAAAAAVASMSAIATDQPRRHSPNARVSATPEACYVDRDDQLLTPTGRDDNRKSANSLYDSDQDATVV